MTTSALEKISQIISILSLLGVANATLIGAVLFYKTKENSSNLFLGIILVALSIFILDSSLLNLQLYHWVPHLYNVETPFVLLIGPACFFYATTRMEKTFCFRIIHILHTIPAFLITVILWFDSYSLPIEEKITLAYQATPMELVDIWATLIIVDLPILIYLILSVIKVVKTKRLRAAHEETLDPIAYKGVLRLLVSFLVLATLATLSDYFSSVFGNLVLVPALSAILIYSIGFTGFQQAKTAPDVFLKNQKKKYSKSSLSLTESTQIYDRAVTLMQSERCFDDNDLSLSTLAKKLGVSSHHLSQAINAVEGVNFFQFLARFRLEEAYKELSDPDTANLTIADIAFGVGFNSLSSFNSAFKKKFEITPSQHRKNSNPRFIPPTR